MTQLFDTAGYDSFEKTARPALAESRHLRSVGAGPSPESARINWRLDDQTIEVGRRGIAMAREALRQSRAVASTETADAVPAIERRAA